MLDLHRRPWLAVVVGVVVLVLAALGATSGLGPLIEDQPRDPISIAPPQIPIASPTAREAAPDMGEELEPPAPPTWFSELLTALIWLVVATVIVGLAVWLALRLRRLSFRRSAPGQEGVEVPEVSEEELVEQFDDTLAQLRTGVGVEDAVVECWRKLEATAARAGVARRATDTSEEFILQVLAGTSVDEAALRELGRLYAQAWYSGRVPGDDARASAVACLERLRSSMEARV